MGILGSIRHRRGCAVYERSHDRRDEERRWTQPRRVVGRISDVILFATGYVFLNNQVQVRGDFSYVRYRFDSPMITAEKILGKDLASRIKPLWNVDAEGEIRTAWRDSGVPNFWFVMGNLMMCRFHSKHLALRECLVWYLSPC